MSSRTVPKSRLEFGWLPWLICTAFCCIFWGMWEEKTMRKHGRGLQNQALQPFGYNSTSQQILECFSKQIEANFSSKIEQKSIEELLWKSNWHLQEPREDQNGAGAIGSSLSGTLLAPSWCLPGPQTVSVRPQTKAQMSSRPASRTPLHIAWSPRLILDLFRSVLGTCGKRKPLKNSGGVIKIKPCTHLDPTEFQVRF